MTVDDVYSPFPKCLKEEELSNAFSWTFFYIGGVANLCTLLVLSLAFLLLSRIPSKTRHFVEAVVVLCRSAMNAGLGQHALTKLLDNAEQKLSLKVLFKNK